MPAYVKRGGLAFDCSPPITAHRARACAFLVPAEVDYINRIIDTQLNYPSQLAVEFYALFPYVLVYFMSIPAITMREAVGSYSEREFGVAIPMVDARTGRPAVTFDYLLVDSGIAMANGREVFGFPKQIGYWETDEPWLDDQGEASPRRPPERFSVNALAIDHFQPLARAAVFNVVTVTREAGESEAPAPVGHGGVLVDALVERVRAEHPRFAERGLTPFATGANDSPSMFTWPYQSPLGAGGRVRLDRRPFVPWPAGLDEGRMPPARVGLTEVAINLAQELVADQVPTVLLKQVRSAVAPVEACYTEVVEVPLSSVYRRGGFFTGQYRVDAQRIDSFPLADELGWTGPVQASLAVWLEFDFVLNMANPLWTARPAKA